MSKDRLENIIKKTVEEMSLSSGAGSYNSKHSFKRKKLRENTKEDIDAQIKDIEDKIDKLPSEKRPGGGGKYSSDSVEGKFNTKLRKKEQNLLQKKEILYRKKKKMREFKYKLTEYGESDTDVKKFQQQRIAAFDQIETELNNIYQMLNTAKNETADHYAAHPGTWEIVKPTDLILDYLEDIKDLLKGG